MNYVPRGLSLESSTFTGLKIALELCSFLAVSSPGAGSGLGVGGCERRCPPPAVSPGTGCGGRCPCTPWGEGRLDRVGGLPGSWWAGCLGPGGWVQQEAPSMGAVVLCSGSHVWGSFYLSPLKALVCQVPWWAPRRLLLERSLACVSPGLHQGGILAAETTLSEVKTATCASEDPSGLTLLPPTSSLLHSLCSCGRWAGPVPLGAGPGSPSEPCTWKPALLTCPAGWGRSEEMTGPTSPPGVPCDLRRFGASESCPGRDPGSPGLQQTSFPSPGRPWPPARSADSTRPWRGEQRQAGSRVP